MSDEPVFRRDGDRFVPTANAASPWGQQVLHGGPPSGLLARAVERANAEAGGDAMQVARFTVDLFRAVPMAPLHTTTREIRRGRRIAVIEATLHAGEVEVARATGLLLLPSESEATVDEPPPPGPDESVAGFGFRPRGRDFDSDEMHVNMSSGFHTGVRIAWATPGDDRAPAAWFSIPMPFVEGEQTTPLMLAVAISDFGNALANTGGVNVGTVSAEGPLSRGGGGFINTDMSLHMHRPPRGEWICLRADHLSQRDGIGTVEVEQFDAAGRYGRSTQARLANPQ